jgi:hypothetical protein
LDLEYFMGANILIDADILGRRLGLRSSTLDSLHTGVSPGSIGCAYTYSGPFRVRADI